MNQNFADVIVEGKKYSQHRCKHCDHQSAKNAARKQQHLKICDAFKKKQNMQQKMMLNKISVQLFIISLICSLNQAQIAQTHRAAAMFVYMTNLSFNHFENSYVIAHHQALNSSYKSSHHKLVEEKLLNETYESVKLKVNQQLNACN
jgi:hypothetical protein